MEAKASGDLLVVLEVAEAAAELSRGRFPDQRGRDRVEVIVELSGAHSEGAQVVADHRLVAQRRGDIPLGPEAARVGGPEELIRQQAVVDAQPEREVALRGTHAGERGDAAGEYEAFIKRVGKVPREHDLCALALGGIGAPGVQEVTEPRIE